MSMDMQISAARILRALLLTSVTASMATMAQAQDGGTTLPTIYYTVSATPVEAGRTGVSASVVTAEDLAQSPLRSLPVFLSSQVGVSATQNGGLGSAAGLRVRGLGGGYLATRLDGIDIADTTGTQIAMDAGMIPTIGLDRVEILRGAQSALHGSEAIGGVVSLSTFRPARDGLSGVTTSEIGSNETAAASTAIGYRDAKTEAAVTLSRVISEGISALANNTEADGFDGTFLSFHLARDVTDNLRIGINGHLRDNHADFDESTKPEGSFTTAETRAYRLFLGGDIGATSHELAYSSVEMDRVSTSGLWGATPFEGTRREWLYTGHWDAAAGLGLNWGFEDSTETFASYGDTGEANTQAVFAEALWAVNEDLDLSFALRGTEHDAFGRHATWRLAAAYRLSDAVTLRGAASTGFTAPSLYQRFSASGQESLAPETAQSTEVGLDYAIGKAVVSATLFDIAITDRIDYVSGAGPCASSWGCYVQIPGETQSRGIELSANLPLSTAWALDANYTYTDAQTSDGKTLARVPAHVVNLNVTGAVTDALSLTTSLQHVAGLEDAVYMAPNLPMDDYTLIHLGADYAISDTASAYVQVQNLFDTDYQSVNGYNQPGREIRLGLRTTF